MTQALLIAVLAVAALAYVSAPLRRRDEERSIDAALGLEEKKTVALTAILDLEDERDVGKLSDEDFAELRGVYEAQALEALHQLDDEAAHDEVDPIEREIARVRDRLSATRCSNCGAPRERGRNPCPACGA